MLQIKITIIDIYFFEQTKMRYITTMEQFYSLAQGVQGRAEQITTSILNNYKQKNSQSMHKHARGCCHHKW